jgi:hypothetical protein
MTSDVDSSEKDSLKVLLKPIKTSLIDLFISLSRVIFFWLPGSDISKGQALMILHLFGGCLIYSLFFILPNGHVCRLFIFLFYAIVVLQQLLFRGCVITKAEQHLTGSSDTIMDPLIRLSGFEPTRELRIATSIGVMFAMTMTLLMNIIVQYFQFNK